MSDIPSASPAWPESVDGRTQGLQAFRQVIREALALTAQQGSPLLILADADFADWPLDEPSVIERLSHWLRAGAGRLQMLAGRYDRLLRDQPRFVDWRRDWSHRIDCHALPEAAAGAAGLKLPSALWSSAVAIERLELVRHTTVCPNTLARRALLHERLKHCLERSNVAAPVTTLGL